MIDVGVRLKHAFVRGVFRSLMKDGGYRVISGGMEDIAREVTLLDDAEFKALELAMPPSCHARLHRVQWAYDRVSPCRGEVPFNFGRAAHFQSGIPPEALSADHVRDDVLERDEPRRTATSL